MSENFKMLAKTMHGLEDVLAKELRNLGAMDIKPVKRGVSFVGDAGFMYKANYWLRTALRILVPIKEFKVRNEEEVYKRIKEIAWEDYFDIDKTIMVNATIYSRQFNHTLYIAQKVKDGIVDRFREKTGERPSVNTDNPDIRIDVYIHNEDVIVSLDSSGHSLHRRGYRKEADVAPINEVLAAGILGLIGFKGMSHLIDPMCGSGTFLIEAAMIAHNIPPGIFREEFAFKNWKNYNKELHDMLFEKSLEKEKNYYYTILGFDKDPRVLLKAGRNIKTALLDEQIKLEKADFLDFKSSREIKTPGILVFNPPYGIKFDADIPELYTGIGNTLKNKFPGFTAWMFTSSKEGLKYVGLKPSLKIPLFNAKLESWLVRYDLYEGTRKDKGNKDS